jgi:hypothetical protein
LDQTHVHPSGASSESSFESSRIVWRNVFSIVTYLRIMQMLTKKKAQRIVLLMQYKATAVLKRILRLDVHFVQLYTLKICKNIVPYTGRKWRSINMRIVTGIYTHCQQNLREEWLMGGEPEIDPEESQLQDQNLRELVRWYNHVYYGFDTDAENKRAHVQVELQCTPPPRPTSALWEEVKEEDFAVFDPTFVNDYERWLEEEVFHAAPEEVSLDEDEWIAHLAELDQDYQQELKVQGLLDEDIRSSMTATPVVGWTTEVSDGHVSEKWVDLVEEAEAWSDHTFIGSEDGQPPHRPNDKPGKWSLDEEEEQTLPPSPPSTSQDLLWASAALH